MSGEGQKLSGGIKFDRPSLFPGLHPDGYDDPDSGWPRVLRPFAAEAWARAEAGDLADDELYPCEAQWCGIFDRMARAPTADETERRVLSAARHSLPPAWQPRA